MTNDNDELEMVCHICGKPTTDREFYTLPSGRRWAHADCMLEMLEEKRLAAARALADKLFNDPVSDAVVQEYLKGTKLQPSAETLFPKPDKSRS
jgi:hypothetical protein